MKILSYHEKSHPDYDKQIHKWIKYRDVLEGGEDFVQKYLRKYSERESDPDFSRRRDITYNPAHAEAALMDIRNSIYQRMTDITRKTDIESFNTSSVGDYRGIDNHGNTLDSFMGRDILTELLFLGKVGIFVDRSPLATTARTKVDRLRYHPYLYKVRAEDIISWAYNTDEQLTSVLVRSEEDKHDDDTGLVIGHETKYKLFRLRNDGVTVQIYDDKNVEEGSPLLLELPEIPLVILQISKSLLTNVAGHQIALLNMESSDVTYAIRSNFTFYIEQYDPRTEGFERGVSTDDDETGSGALTDDAGTQKDVRVGSTIGRRYPLGVAAPGFINPSPEPLQASMGKEDEIRRDIRTLVNLNLASLESRRASADSKKEDARGLESGLSYVGLELEHGEREVARKWAMYESNSSPNILIKYPSTYDLKTDGERLDESEKYIKLSDKVPSPKFRRQMMKRATTSLLGTKSKYEEIEAIHREIDELPPVSTDVLTLTEYHKEGLVGSELASNLAGFPKGEVEKAKKDHAERAARIVRAQTRAAGREPGAAGVQDLGDDLGSADEEKEND